MSVPIASFTPALCARLETGDVLLDRGLGLADNIRADAGAGAVLHHIADRGRGRDQIGAAFEHELDAFVVEQIAMLDRIDASFDRILDRGRAMRMRARRFFRRRAPLRPRRAFLRR